MPYDGIDMNQHWALAWVIAWQHQAITWNNVDISSVGSCAIYQKTVALEMH